MAYIFFKYLANWTDNAKNTNMRDGFLISKNILFHYLNAN